MMKMRVAITVCLAISLLAFAGATSLELVQKHVFAEEDFSVLFRANAPLSQHKAKITFEDQEKTFTIPGKSTGMFTKNLVFKAPDKPGEYKLEGEGTNNAVKVEKPLLILENVKLDKNEIKPGEAAHLEFTISNPGEYMVYNVAYQLVLSNPDHYSFNSEKQELGNFKSGESQTKIIELKAKPGAETPTSVKLTVEYIFDGETHYRTAEERLSVDTSNWADWVMYVLVIIAVIVILLEIYSILTKRVNPKN
ncbi:MAG: hypothetical protein J7L23_03690 [Candidatus Diapherotrites archaeon]|nr:hypothetical protein [Candidatus Diapherotrites archaeon]